MYYKTEFDLNTFEAWSGAVDTVETIKEHNKVEDFNMLIEDLFYETPTETQINDLLWHDTSFVYESLGIGED